jgi:ATP adenylyltransferase
MEVGMSNCLFCSVYDQLETHPRQIEDTVLAESEFFYLKPTLGHFIEGYCLIISKDHYRTIAEIPREMMSDLVSFSDTVKRTIEEKYGPNIVSFEHGAVCPTERMGSCIDHAHLHVVPLPTNEIPRLRPIDGQDLSSIEEIHSMTQGRPYLYFEADNCMTVSIGPQRLPSQYMRRVIAAAVGLDDKWDWRKNPYREKIERFCAWYLKEATFKTSESCRVVHV